MSWIVSSPLVEGVALIVLALLWGAWWLWWRFPKRQVERLSLKIRDPKARADIEDSFRKTVGQLLGGVAFLLGTGLAYLQFSEQQRDAHQEQQITRDQFLQQQQAARDQLISTQVAKGFEQLGQTGSDKLMLRIGGIYGLEYVMNTYPQYHQQVLEALCAFVRSGTIAAINLNVAPATNATIRSYAPPAYDIQAALTVIGRRAAGAGNINLSGIRLPDANLFGADLRDADLFRAHLEGANLNSAHLEGAHLEDAHLEGAHLERAHLEGAHLTSAQLEAGDLTDANLTDAYLLTTDLTSAYLLRAHLTNAQLEATDLTDANLGFTDLTHAYLRGSRLTGSNVSQLQLNEACGTGVILPPGLTLKPWAPSK